METAKIPQEMGQVSDHLANERTFLAWIRTSIGIMGFGFVVVKFSMFVRQISVALGTVQTVHQTGYSHVIGTILVAIGGITIGFSYLRYSKTRKQLNSGIYYQSGLFVKIITTALFIICLLLLIYLLKT